MANADVLTPKTGNIWSLACYCNSSMRCSDGQLKACLTNPDGPCNPSSCSQCCDACCCTYGCCTSNCPNPGATKCCRTCNHTITQSGYIKPIDIGGGWQGGNVITFYGTSNIKSIKIEYVSNICSGGTPTPWTYGVKVHLYKNPDACCLIGTVLYAHLQNRETYAPNWSVWNYPYPNSGGKHLGQVPADCQCGCSSGIHLHMECKSGGTRNTLTCGVQVIQNSTWLYRFTVPATCAPCPMNSQG